MAERLQADLDGLRAVSSQLSAIATKIDGTQNAFMTASFDIGSMAVEGALEDFERTWDVGRKRIHDDIDALGSMLDDSADTYQKTDQQVAQAFTPDDSAADGPADHPAGGGGGGSAR